MEKPYRTMIHMFYRKMMPMNLLISQFEVKFYLALLQVMMQKAAKAALLFKFWLKKENESALVCCVHQSHSAIMTELIRIQRIHGCFLIQSLCAGLLKAILLLSIAAAFPLRNIQSQNKFHFAMENIMSFTMSLQKLQSVYI